MNREYVARETRWVREYVKKHYPIAEAHGDIEYQASLGPLAGTEFDRKAPRVDALISLHGFVVLAEFKVDELSCGLGQLLLYELAFPLTPNRKDTKLPINKLLVVLDYPDDMHKLFAAKYGISIDMDAPEWLVQYVQERGISRRP